jgi:uncharacterized Tic20 family protein
MVEEQTHQQPQTPEKPQQAEQAAPAAAEIPSDAKTMAMLCHLLAIAIVFVGPLAILGPLIIWLIKKDQHQFIDEQGKESVNFQITVLIAMVALFILGFITCGVGFFLMPVVAIVDIVFCIIATIKANSGEHYRYPIALRLVK